MFSGDRRPDSACRVDRGEMLPDRYQKCRAQECSDTCILPNALVEGIASRRCGPPAQLGDDGGDPQDALALHIYAYITPSGVVRLTLHLRTVVTPPALDSHQAQQLGHLDRRRRDGVLYNGCDAQRFAPVSDREAVRRALGFSAEARLMLFCGSVIERKGIRNLARAWERFCTHDGEWQLVVVGRLVEPELVRLLASTRPSNARRSGRSSGSADLYAGS